MPAINQQKRNDILEAALEQFAERGFHDAPMAQLAKKSNIAVGTIYRCFKDKEELIHELYKEVDDSLQSALVREVESTSSTQQEFVDLVSNLIHYLADHPHEFKFLEQYYNSPFGIEKKREKFLISGSSGQQSAFRNFFSGTTNNDIKSLPGHVLHALTFGPVIFLLRDVASGLIELDESLIKTLAEGCWDAIKK